MRTCLLIIALTTTLLCGCSTIRNGGAPRPTFNIQNDIKAISAQYAGAGSVTNYYAKVKELETSDTPGIKNARDEYITARLVLIDLEYVVFIRSLTRDRQLLDAGADILTMSLNLTGAGVSGAAAKTILASLAAGITGSKVTMDRDFFYDKTVPAMVAAMNAERSKARIPLIRGLKSDPTDYPFHQALIDTQLYYESGTFLGAINGIQESAAAKETLSNNEIKEITDISEVDYANLKVLSKFLPKLNAADLDKAWIALKTAAGPAIQDEKPNTVAGFKAIYIKAYRGMTTADRVNLYNRLVEQNLIKP